MKELPNGLVVFNTTPHTIRFWAEGWPEPIEVESDEIISIGAQERVVGKFEIPPAISNLCPYDIEQGTENVTFVKATFMGTLKGDNLIRRALEEGADVIVGSIIAAQAYPGLVAVVIPVSGYERAPPDEERVIPDRFVLF